SKGLEAAKRYANIAPDASHAHHMPSHIFTRVGFWRESVASNQESVAAARGDALYTLHGWDYMAYAYLQMANDAAAEKVGAEALAHGTLDNVSFGAVFGAAAIPARLALERGRWAEAAALALPANVSAGARQRFPPGDTLKPSSLERWGRRVAATPPVRVRRSSVCTPCTRCSRNASWPTGPSRRRSRPRLPAPGPCSLRARRKRRWPLCGLL